VGREQLNDRSNALREIRIFTSCQAQNFDMPDIVIAGKSDHIQGRGRSSIEIIMRKGLAKFSRGNGKRAMARFRHDPNDV
jgi:hypothetical protein